MATCLGVPSPCRVARWAPTWGVQAVIRRRWAVAAAGKKQPEGSFGDELLDFMYAGKKLRKWYGEEGMVLPKDGGGGEERGPGPQEAEEPEGEKTAVLVLDADSPTGEQVVLQLILARAEIKALVKDGAAAAAGFGPYITPVQGNAGDAAALRSALRGVRAVVATGRLGALLPAAKAAGVRHVVLLSSAGAPRRGLALFGGGEAGVLGDAERQAAVLGSGLAVTVVQVGEVRDEPGTGSIAVGMGGSPAGEISREDAAKVLARVAVGPDPPAGVPAVVLQARQGGSGQQDWEAALDALLQKQPA